MNHRTARLCVLALGGLSIAGCATPKPTPPEPAQAATPSHAALAVGGRINAVVGRPLVVAINAPAEGTVEARLDDGRLLLSRAARITLRAATDADPWLGPIPQWTSEPLDPAAQPSPADTWLALVETPIDTAGHDILINGQRISLTWLPPTSTLPKSDAEGRADAWTPTRPAAMPTEAPDARRFADESRSPFTRWRYRLLVEGLHPDATPLPGFTDPIAEAFAQQEEDRWRVALAWLWGADPDVADRVRTRLAAVIEFAPGQWAPAWSTDADRLRRLLDDLLNPSLSPQRRAAQAARWLEESPPMAAWVIDDGGRTDPATGNIQPTIAVASLLDRSTLAWVSWSGEGGRSPDLQPLPSMTLREFTLSPLGTEGPAARSVQAHAGRDSVTLPTLARPIPARPPGLALRPFAPDWSMDALLLGQFAPPDASWETASLLYKRADSPASADTPSRAAGWEILIECKSADGLADERVDLHLGPTANPLGLIRVWRDGRVETFGAIIDSTDAPTVIRSDDRWSARIPIPPTCIEPGNLLRLGLTRLDARGQRSAVPRAIMPWHDHPARVAVDLTSWEK